MSTTESSLFLISPCFNNYDIIAGEVFKTFINKSIKDNTDNKEIKEIKEIKTFFDDTPFALYSVNMNNPDIISYCKKNRVFSKCEQQSSAQVQMFVIILSMLAVCMARIYNSKAVININTGVLDIAGLSTLSSFSNFLSKPTVIWNDDMRTSWGVSNDPLVIGSLPNFFRNLYGVSSEQKGYETYNKNILNSANPPQMGTGVKCPVKNAALNVFTEMLSNSFSNENTTQDDSQIPTRMSNLIVLGNKMIKFVEDDKTTEQGWDLGVNTTLFFDLYYVMRQNADLLTSTQNAFLCTNEAAATEIWGTGPTKLSCSKKEILNKLKPPENVKKYVNHVFNMY